MNFSTPIDKLSLAALKKDCRRTQERVYRTFSPAAWSLALRLSGCEAQAWDAVQAGFVRAFEKVSQLREADRFGAWLKRIIVNQVMDQHRQRFDALPEGGEDGDAESHGHDQRMDLERALARLTPLDRTVVWLHDAEGYTHAEIAELAGQTPSWSKTRLSRARARLRPFLEPGLSPVKTADGSSA
jgi:RNA polymerase sigma-70 factor (ECF subfamily)